VHEYLGDDLHGHRSRWESNHADTDRNGDSCMANYFDTQKKMLKLKELGYRVFLHLVHGLSKAPSQR
jgi:hypothetical protein